LTQPAVRAWQAWHELLDADEAMALESASQLDSALRRDDLLFGERALCTVLRPRFFTPESYRTLCDRMALVMRGFRAAYAHALAEPAVLDQFRLAEWERTLIAEDRSGILPSPTTRMDAFLTADGGMSITEYNAETPAAPAFNDALARSFANLPVMRQFSRDWWCRSIESRHGVLRVLLDSWERWSGGRTLPRIAILDWPDVPTKREFELFRDYFVSQGLECVIGDPRACEYTKGVLWLDGVPVDLVYKRVLIHELVEREGLESPLMRAVRDNAVCFVNGFRSKILHKKASLAVLSDHANAHWFDPDVRAAVRAFIPWTRVVEERTTTSPDGTAVDLLRYIEDNRDQLVLKPNDDYGGHGIVLGWTVGVDEWSASVRKALAEPYIVQQRVMIPRESFPSVENGTLGYLDRQVDTAPFICDSTYVEGVLSRLSTAELLNVTAGGGSQTPTFLVEPR
jgi:hypothetical protein